MRTLIVIVGSILVLVLLLSGIVLAAPAAAPSATCIWDGTTGNWSDTTKWSCGAVPGASDTATISDGTVTVDVDSTIQSLNFIGGTLTGNNSITVTQSMTWTNGWMGGYGTTAIPAGATLSINPATDCNSYDGIHLPRRTLNVAGMATLTGTHTVCIESNAVINNSGVFDVQSDMTVANSPYENPTAVLTNTGTFRKTGGAGTSAWTSVAINNTDTVQAQSGTLRLANGGSSSGSFSAEMGATLDFGGGTHAITLAAASSISGAGTVSFTGGNTTLAGSGAYAVTGKTVVNNGSDTLYVNLNATMAQLQFINGTLSGNGALTVTQAMTWTNGWMGGYGTTAIPAGATLSINPATDCNSYDGIHLPRRTLNVAGTATLTGTHTVCIESNAVINNSGVFDVQSDMTVANSPYENPTAVLTNTGTFRKTGGAGTSAWTSVAINNTGTVQAQSGTLRLDIGFTQNGGATVLNGGSLSKSSGTFNFYGGMIQGTGIITGNVANNGGIISSGDSPGVLHIVGNYTQGPTGTLNIELGGPISGTEYDLLDVTGNAALSGTLNVSLTNSYTPISGTLFRVLNYATHSGNFSTLNGLSQGDVALQPNWNADNLTLAASDSPRQNQTITFDPLPDKTWGDPPFIVSATASSGLPVTFTTTSPACSLSGDQVTLLSTGSCAITAHQAGDASYYPAPDVTQSFSINRASQTITFDPLPDEILGDPPFMLIATASSWLPVTFTTSSSACSVAGNQVTLLSVGSCAITAHQAGSAAFYPAPDVTQGFTIETIEFVFRVKSGGLMSGMCDSWANACDLQYAITHAIFGTEIWVAQGVYTPGIHITSTFQLTNGVALYGGFAMTETQRTQRDWGANATVLSGDIDANDWNTDTNDIAETWDDLVGSNAYHVVTGGGTAQSARLDGFIITAGNANGSGYPDTYGGGVLNGPGAPTLVNLTFKGNRAVSYGGAMVNLSSSPVLDNLMFSGNYATLGGGAMYNNLSDLVQRGLAINRITFRSNQAGGYGGALMSLGGAPALTNVTFVGNSALNMGGAMWNEAGVPTLTNVIVTGNRADTCGGLAFSHNKPTLINVTISGNWANTGGSLCHNESSGTKRMTLVNSILWDNWPQNLSYSLPPKIIYSVLDWSDEGNIDADPQFVAPIAASFAPTTTGDYHLLLTSPAIDAGNNLSTTASTDLDGHPRQVDVPSVPDTGLGTPPIVDMGAYETFLSQGLTCTWQSYGGSWIGYWGNPNFWSCGAVPGRDDVAVINNMWAYVQLTSDVTVRDLILSDGVLLVGTGNGSIVTRRLSWTGGYLGGSSGRITIAPGARLDLGGGQTLNLGLINQGIADWTAGSISIGRWGWFINEGSFNVSGNGSMLGTDDNWGFRNSGAFTKTATSGGRVAIQIPFINTGLVNVQAGSLNLSSSFTQDSGVTSLSGGELEGNLNLNGGVLRGTGTIMGNVSNLGGTVAPGSSPGVLRIVNYTQGPTGTLALELGGIVSGTQYDVLDVTGNTTLSGTLDVSLINSFTPTLGTVFRVMNFGARSGDFSTLNGLSQGGVLLQPTWNADNLTLTTAKQQFSGIKSAALPRWVLQRTPLGTLYGRVQQDYAIRYSNNNSPYGPSVTVAVTDTLPAELAFRSQTHTLAMNWQQLGNRLTWETLSPVRPGQSGLIQLSTVNTNSVPGRSITNPAELSAGAIHLDLQAASRTPLFAPLITSPGRGETLAGTLPVRGAAQPGVTVTLVANGAVIAQTLADASGAFTTAYSYPGTVTVTLKAQACVAGPLCSGDSNTVTLTPPKSFWCPLRSKLIGVRLGSLADVSKLGPQAGQPLTFEFRNSTGQFATQNWVIPIVSGLSNTTLRLYVGNYPDTSTPPDRVWVVADGQTYTPTEVTPPWYTFSVVVAHSVQLCAGLGSATTCTTGTVWIDPAGYVFDVTKGLSVTTTTMTGHLSPMAVTNALKGITVTAMVSLPQWGGWVPWPAHLYNDQANPQVTGSDGYFAFFTPPGDYYLQVDGIAGYQKWRSPVMHVSTEIVHVNVPLTPVGVAQSMPTYAVTLTQAGPTPAVMTVTVGSAVEWTAELSGTLPMEQLMSLIDNPASRPLSVRNPLSDTLGWDGGLLSPGQVYQRSFMWAGTYGYTDGAGHPGQVVVMNHKVYLPLVVK